MTYRAHVENGQVVLDEPVQLTNGVQLRVEVLPTTQGTPPLDQGPSLYEQLQSVIGIIDDLPTDMARNHDHYIHGTPKK